MSRESDVRPEASKGRVKEYLTALALVVAAIMALGLWVIDGSTIGPRTIRCRRMITVDTPEGKRFGASVVESKISFPGGLTRAQGYAVLSKDQGEATVVDLGSRGLLFVTLANEERLRNAGVHGSDFGCFSPFPREKFRGKVSTNVSANEEYAAYLDELNKQKPKGDVPFKYLPMLVRFLDLHNPASVERVEPSDLASSFGDGVEFESMSIEITDVPVTENMTAALPWLASDDSRRLVPQTQRSRDNSEIRSVDLLTYNDLRRLPK